MTSKFQRMIWEKLQYSNNPGRYFLATEFMQNPKCNKVEIKKISFFSVFFLYDSFPAFIDQEEKPSN